MKNTLEELKAAQSKGCRIEYQWIEIFVPIDQFDQQATLRIHPADEWKAANLQPFLP